MAQVDTLTSLAILKVNWDTSGHDYADNFLPFVLEAIYALPHPEISVAAVQRTIRDDFGLIIPQGALNTLLILSSFRGRLIRYLSEWFRFAHSNSASQMLVARDIPATSAYVQRCKTFRCS
jgi:hypothetical protein